MKPMRGINNIRFDLETARAYRATYATRQSDDPWVRRMQDDNDRDLAALEQELSSASSSELEVSLEGVPVQEHTVTVPFFQRVLEQLQAVFRSARRASLAPGEALSRKESALVLGGTAPGSFRAYFSVPPTQLQLEELPAADTALVGIVDLLMAAEGSGLGEAAGNWAARADEPAVRAMIKLTSTLAGAHGRTDIRLRTADGAERIVRLSAEQARQLAVALAGETGREMVQVTGHLQMAQDDPPRVRITTADDQYLADVLTEELLDQV